MKPNCWAFGLLPSLILCRGFLAGCFVHAIERNRPWNPPWGSSPSRDTWSRTLPVWCFTTPFWRGCRGFSPFYDVRTRFSLPEQRRINDPMRSTSPDCCSRWVLPPLYYFGITLKIILFDGNSISNTLLCNIDQGLTGQWPWHERTL